MTDLVTPGEVNAEIDNLSAGHAWQHSGVGAWIVDGVDIAGNFSTIDTTGVSGFTHDATSGLTLTFSGGEAYVGGWLVRDRTTDVDVPDGATSIVYVGYDPGQTLGSTEAPADNENVVVGTSAAFDATMPKAALYEVTASGGTVDSVTDLRKLEPPLRFDGERDQLQIEGSTLGISNETASVGENAVYSAGGATVQLASDGALDTVEIAGERARGTSLDNPQPVQADDWLFKLMGRARNGNGEFVAAGDITVRVASALQGTNNEIVPTQINFRTQDTNGDLYSRAIIHPGGILEAKHGLQASGGLVDNTGGDGVQPPDIAGGSLPSDTEAGRIIYDSSREQ